MPLALYKLIWIDLFYVECQDDDYKKWNTINKTAGDYFFLKYILLSLNKIYNT